MEWQREKNIYINMNVKEKESVQEGRFFLREKNKTMFSIPSTFVLIQHDILQETFDKKI